MKRLIQINVVAIAVLFAAACNNDNGSSIPKGDPAIVHTGDSSSASSPTSGAATGTTNNSSVPAPEAATPDSGGKKGKDSTTMKKP